MGFFEIPMDFHGFLWNLMEFLRNFQQSIVKAGQCSSEFELILTSLKKFVEKANREPQNLADQDDEKNNDSDDDRCHKNNPENRHKNNPENHHKK